MHMVDWIEANKVWLRFAQDGAGDRTVILVHEMGGTLDSWDEVVPYLSKDYRVLRYDMRGFGLSQKIFGAFTLDDAIADLTGFIDAMGVTGPVALVGCAVGAGICMRVAAMRPDQVKALVTMAPATEVPPERIAKARSLPDRLGQIGIRQLVDGGIAPAEYPQHLRTDADRYRRFLGQQSSMDPESFVATFTMLLDGEYQPYFEHIKCPTLVVAGQYDKGRSPDIVEPVARQIPGARFETVPVGHFMAVQAPDLIGAMIFGFLEDVGY